MLDKKTTKDYVNEISKEFGITKKAARTIITFGMKNICRMIKRGEDIQLQHFGSIYFNKKAYSHYLQKVNQSEKKSNNHSDNNVRGSKNQ